jgi:hypothetical protein
MRGVLVLGMHRSGTSAATRLVNLLGPATCAPSDMVRGPWNPSGHFESRTLMHLNNDLLAQMGRTWWYPPPAGERYAEVASTVTTTPRQARRIFRRVHPSAPWVWKDPRTCVVLPFWRRALGPRLAGVVVFRHPHEVAESLQRRHGVSVPFGLALWERYNRLLLAHAEAMPVHVSSYDELMGAPVRWTTDVAAFLAGHGVRLDARVDEDAVRTFVDPGLRHSDHGRRDLSEASTGVAAVYDALASRRGDSPSFVPPPLGPEPPWVEEELATVGADHEPAWHPPPGVSAADRSGTPAASAPPARPTGAGGGAPGTNSSFLTRPEPGDRA